VAGSEEVLFAQLKVKYEQQQTNLETTTSWTGKTSTTKTYRADGIDATSSLLGGDQRYNWMSYTDA